MPVDHKNVVDTVITALKAMSQAHGYSASDIKYMDFPFHRKPPFGLIVSALTEVEGESTTSTSDVGYPVQITRIGHRLNGSDGLESRDDWRRAVWRRFNRTRLGLECELMTRSEFDRIELKEAWDSWNIDSSVLKVTVWIRELHNG